MININWLLQKIKENERGATGPSNQSARLDLLSSIFILQFSLYKLDTYLRVGVKRLFHDFHFLINRGDLENIFLFLIIKKKKKKKKKKKFNEILLSLNIKITMI